MAFGHGVCPMEYEGSLALSADVARFDLPMNAPAQAASGRASYAAARRHSRRVKFLKRAIPIGSTLAILAVMFIGIFDPFRHIGAVSIGPVSLSGTKITMEKPRLTGFRAKDASPYEVTAESATQDVRRPTIVEMTKIIANVTMENADRAKLEADSGVYDTQKEQIELKSNVRVRTQGGYDARLNSAFVDFKGGSVTSDEPVSVLFNGGSIESQRLDITDNGARLTFEGRVRAILKPAPDQAAPQR